MPLLQNKDSIQCSDKIAHMQYMAPPHHCNTEAHSHNLVATHGCTTLSDHHDKSHSS